MQLEKKLKIAIAHPKFNEFGGAEQVILNLCRHWVLNGHSVTVFSSHFPSAITQINIFKVRGEPYIAKSIQCTKLSLVYKHTTSRAP